MTKTVLGLKDTLINLFKPYWNGAIVAWAMQGAPKPEDPLILLKMGTVKTATFPDEMVDDNGEVHYQYPSSVILEINFFSNGTIANPESEYSSKINTTESDLLEFVKYLKTPLAMEACKAENISIMLYSDVVDASEILNELDYEYRAMVELKVDFVTETVGLGNVNITEDNGWFNKVNISEGGN